MNDVPAEDPDTVLDVAEVARRLRTSRDTVYDLVASGKLKAKRLGKQRVIRVPLWALLEYIRTPDN